MVPTCIEGSMQRMRSWWQARRRRRRIRQLSRVFDPTVLETSDRSSAALLAVLTERIARMTSARASLDEVTAAIADARRAYDGYQPLVSRCRELRDDARLEVAKWRNLASRAQVMGEPDLAAAARERFEQWERQERDASTSFHECVAGMNRLADAITELQRLADRLRKPGL